jgi:hypothetical protein
MLSVYAHGWGTGARDVIRSPRLQVQNSTHAMRGSTETRKRRTLFFIYDSIELVQIEWNFGSKNLMVATTRERELEQLEHLSQRAKMRVTEVKSLASSIRIVPRSTRQGACSGPSPCPLSRRCPDGAWCAVCTAPTGEHACACLPVQRQNPCSASLPPSHVAHVANQDESRSMNSRMHECCGTSFGCFTLNVSLWSRSKHCEQAQAGHRRRKQ